MLSRVFLECEWGVVELIVCAMSSWFVLVSGGSAECAVVCGVSSGVIDAVVRLDECVDV